MITSKSTARLDGHELGVIIYAALSVIRISVRFFISSLHILVDHPPYSLMAEWEAHPVVSKFGLRMLHPAQP
jgi:hypothetical protein